VALDACVSAAEYQP